MYSPVGAKYFLAKYIIGRTIKLRDHAPRRRDDHSPGGNVPGIDRLLIEPVSATSSNPGDTERR